MVTRGHIETELIDDNVVYATPYDVFTLIRNKGFDDLPEDPTSSQGGTLTQTQVVSLIEKFSERADITTKRAWRERRVNDYDVRIKFSSKLKRGRSRRRSRLGRGGTSRISRRGGRRGMGDMPHIDVQDLEKVEVINPRSLNDITDAEGREKDFVVDYRKGVIRPNVYLFVPTGRGSSVNATDIEDARIRVTYTYGKTGSEPHDALPTGTELSTTVPPDVSDAVALMTAARIVGSDQYGELVPNQGGDTPSLSDAASTWEQNAKETLKEYTRI